MCAITLIVLQTCKHELPTIEFCPDAARRLKKSNKKRKHGVEALLPATCTDSLGWTIFKSVDAPVVCEGCKMWLYMHGKKTYSMMQESDSAVEPEEEVVDGDVEIKKTEIEDDDTKDEKDKKEETLTKFSGANEMQKLQSKLSRTFGVTGQRRKTPF